MTADASRLRNWLNDAAMANGFHSVHVTAATLPETTGTHLRQFIAQGFAGDMRWLADTAARRSQPRAEVAPAGRAAGALAKGRARRWELRVGGGLELLLLVS